LKPWVRHTTGTTEKHERCLPRCLPQNWVFAREEEQRLAAVKVEEGAELLIGVFIDAARRGDWRAAEALLMRVFGKPPERVEVSQPHTSRTWRS
jgi:hypothetical protein